MVCLLSLFSLALDLSISISVACKTIYNKFKYYLI